MWKIFTVCILSNSNHVERQLARRHEPAFTPICCTHLLSTWEGKLSSFFPTSWNYILVQKVPWILRVEGNKLTACLNIDVEHWNDENGNTCFRILSSLNREFWLILFPFFWHGKVSLNMEEIFATLHEHDFFSQVEQYE